MVQESWSWDHGKVPIQDFFLFIHKTRGSEWSNRAHKRVSRESLWNWRRWIDHEGRQTSLARTCPQTERTCPPKRLTQLLFVAERWTTHRWKACFLVDTKSSRSMVSESQGQRKQYSKLAGSSIHSKHRPVQFNASVDRGVQTASRRHQASLSLTSSLIQSLTSKATVPESSVPTPKSKAKIHQEARQEARCAAAELHKPLPEKLQLAQSFACEKGASSWLKTLPLKLHGFELPNGSFRDTLSLHYGWQVPQLHTTCACGSAMEVEHALSCRFGGLPIRRHNEVRNLQASCLRKAGCDTTIEPLLQPLSGEVFNRPTTTTDQDARLDIKASGFWVGVRGSIFWRMGVQPIRSLVPLPTHSIHIPSTREGEARQVWGESLRSGEGGVHTTVVLDDRQC